MANSYYNFDNSFIPGTKVRSDQMNNELKGVESAFDFLPSDPTTITRGTSTLGIDSQGANANEYDITMENTRASVQAGDEVVFLATHTNTGSGVVINVDGTGDVQARGADLAVLAAGDIVSGLYYVFRHTGSVYQMIGNTPSYLASTIAAGAAATEAASNAQASEASVEADALAAAASASAASSSESAASSSASAASSSASAASGSASAASSSASAASTSASNAATSESNASTSESNASTSASNAATSESNAATSETNAATSETNAANSETNAAASASTAATAISGAEDAVEAAEAWAITPENSPVAVEYGGDGSSTFSALHWAAKSAELSEAGVVTGTGTAALTVLAGSRDYDAKLLFNNADDVETAQIGWDETDGAFGVHSKARHSGFRITSTHNIVGTPFVTADFRATAVTIQHPTLDESSPAITTSAASGLTLQGPTGQDSIIKLDAPGAGTTTAEAEIGYVTADDALVILSKQNSSWVTLSGTNSSGTENPLLSIDPDEHWSFYTDGDQSFYRIGDSVALVPASTSAAKYTLRQAGNASQSALLGFRGGDILYVGNDIHAGSVALYGRESGGVIRDLAIFDPEGSFTLVHDGANHTYSSADALNVAPSSSTQCSVNLRNSADSATQGFLGYDGTADLAVSNAGGSVQLESEGVVTLEATDTTVSVRTGAIGVSNSNTLRRVATIDDLQYVSLVATDTLLPHSPDALVTVISDTVPVFTKGILEVYLMMQPFGEAGVEVSVSLIPSSGGGSISTTIASLEYLSDTGNSRTVGTFSNGVGINLSEANAPIASSAIVKLTAIVTSTMVAAANLLVRAGYEAATGGIEGGSLSTCKANSYFRLHILEH